MEKLIVQLIAQLLFRNESCNTVQEFRDRLYKDSENTNVLKLKRVGLEAEELLSSYGYSSLPFVWNKLLSRMYTPRSVDEFWGYVWSNHIENRGAHKPDQGNVPEKLNSEQEETIREILLGWDTQLSQMINFNQWGFFTLAIVPAKDYLYVGKGQMPLEDENHPLTNFLRNSEELVLAKTKDKLNIITGEPLEILHLTLPYEFKDFFNSYAALRTGTAAISSKVKLENLENLQNSKQLIATEVALSNKQVSFQYLQTLHNSILNYG